MLRMRRAAVGLFVVLWITAMSTYPGWTQFDANSVGHDWWRNFLCDLLAAETPDGRINLLGSIAMTVSVVVVIFGGVGLVPTAMVMLEDWRRADCTWLRRFAIVGLGISAVTNFVTCSIVQLGGELTPVVPTAQKSSIVFLLLWLWLVDHRTPSRLA
ncbi:MAG: hypothetical protein ACI8UD_001058 [Planctomycetota bacterium]|jgi:hypothetical protein